MHFRNERRRKNICTDLKASEGFLIKTKMKAETKLTLVMWYQIFYLKSTVTSSGHSCRQQSSRNLLLLPTQHGCCLTWKNCNAHPQWLTRAAAKACTSGYKSLSQVYKKRLLFHLTKIRVWTIFQELHEFDEFDLRLKYQGAMILRNDKLHFSP